MKMGGIDIISTYVFWIHHEEIEGEWNWLERRNLRQFITLCSELKLLAVVRCGPWCHGECRNGGLPDWLLSKPCNTRSNDEMYLHFSRILYSQIEHQIRGLLWKDNGPVIGIQCENEYSGPAEHLLALKQIALEVGLDVPLYTCTGWPELSTPMPHGELAPLYGGYPDGFWDRSLGQMPPGYAENYLFRSTRNDASVATDQLGFRDSTAEPENEQYPYFACEIGGGMMPSYHRRIRIAPQDIEALALAKLGSGNNLQGYYMYHGGTNPEGVLSTLQESQATGYWNDLPIKSYDFQAPLGEFGQVRDHYHLLRKLHLFIRDWSEDLAAMHSAFPEIAPQNSQDLDTLRWVVRTDGVSGFIFVNNYQRLSNMPCKKDVLFSFHTKECSITVPQEAMTVPANTSFILPVNLVIEGAQLLYSTAQLLCKLTTGNTTTLLFGEIEGVNTEFLFNKATVRCTYADYFPITTDSTIKFSHLSTGRHCEIAIETVTGHKLQIVLLSSKDALRCWKGELSGHVRLFITSSTLLLDSDKLHLNGYNADAMKVSIFPPPASLKQGGKEVASEQDGIFTKFLPAVFQPCTHRLEFVKIRSASMPPQVHAGSQGVAEAPIDEAFQTAGVWKIIIPDNNADTRLPQISIHYIGDVARLYLNDKLLLDNFYNGNPFEIDLNDFKPDIFMGTLTLQILPLRSESPIYIDRNVLPNFGENKTVCELLNVDIAEIYTAEMECVEALIKEKTD